MKQLIHYIKTIVKLGTEALSELELRTEIETYSKNQHIIEYGQRCGKIWFIKFGMVIKYHIQNGKDITRWILQKTKFSLHCKAILCKHQLNICRLVNQLKL